MSVIQPGTGVQFPLVIAASGPVPTPPAVILETLTSLVSATNPGYTNNLPGSLIEDISSTDVAAAVLSDQARVELVNSLTAFGANEFTLVQLGQLYGVPLGLDTNTSVNLVFTGPPGFVIPIGFTVSDGSNQYTVQDGGIIGSGSQSLPLFSLATQPGSFVVSPGTVTQLVTSVPTGLSPPLSVVNPLAGTPSQGAQTAQSYRTQVLQAGLVASQGMGRALKTLLSNVPGVQQNLVSVPQQGSGWEVIVGGGDPYQIAYAIWKSLFDINTLVGSTLLVTAITNANPGVMTTNLNHGFTTGQVINVTGVVGITGINGTPLTITVLTAKTFSLGINTTSSGTYISGGIVTPNFRNQVIAINDFPNTYSIPFVLPPVQTVGIVVTWNTNSVTFVSAAAISQLATPALINYINSIFVGQPINLIVLTETFQVAVAGAIPAALLTRFVFAITINGVATSPVSGTQIINGDPESSFNATTATIVVNQG